MNTEDTIHYRVTNLENGQTQVKQDIREIKENHLEHLKQDLNEVKNCQSGMKQDLIWLKKFFWIIATASVGSLAAGLINMLINVS